MKQPTRKRMKSSTKNGNPGLQVKRPAGSDRAEMGMSEPAIAAADSSSFVSAGGGGGGASAASGRNMEMGKSKPAAAADPSSSGSAGGGGGGAAASGPKMNEAIAYLTAVKDVFKDDQDTYNEFLNEMKNFRARRLDIPGVIIRLKELFTGHPALILGLNTFLPKDYKIILPEKEEQHTSQPPIGLDSGMDFVRKVKTRFQNDQQVLGAFMKIVIMQELYHEGARLLAQHIDLFQNDQQLFRLMEVLIMLELHQEGEKLLAQHTDLLDEFNSFFPDSWAPAVTLATLREGPATNLWSAATILLSWLSVAVEIMQVAGDLDQEDRSKSENCGTSQHTSEG